MTAIPAEERITGGLVGLAAGDALGLPVEFEGRSERDADPVTGMRAGGVWGMPAGTWSDDSSLALCLADSIARKSFDPDDFGQRALDWLDRGLWTPFGEAFDVGGATRRSLGRKRSGTPAISAGGRTEADNGNGSLMRALPAAAWLARSPEPLRFRAVAAYSAVTHAHPRSILACWIHALLVSRLAAGEGPAEAYKEAIREAKTGLGGLPPAIRAEESSFSRVLGGALPDLGRNEIQSSGYVVDSLEAAIWCLLMTADFRSAVLEAVNLGDDADTTGAIAGGLAGLAYGLSGIPAEWRAALARGSEIEALGRELAELALRPSPGGDAYWILPGKLLAGDYPREPGESESRAKLAAILDAGASAFLDLTEAGEILRGREVQPYAELLHGVAEEHGLRVETRRRSIRDMSAASGDTLDRALRDIEEYLASGRTAYFHCLGGIGRTGTVAGSWLVERGLASADEALNLIAALRSGTDSASARSPETEEQRFLVRSRRPGPRAWTH